ncbi:MAG: hypothetical protein FK732_03735 [Asgard group archaeon]|nr:hypothetical protein [Asgard group archaeon]
MTRTSQPFLTRMGLFCQNIFTKTFFIQFRPVFCGGLALRKSSLIPVLVLLAVFSASTMLPSIPIVRAQENTWRTLAPMPTSRNVGGIAVVYNKIYVIGGYNDGYLSTNEMYDPVTNTWITKTPMPTPRQSFAIEVFQNKIYCIGGSTGNGYTSVTEVYDPLTDTWESKAAIPAPRSQLTANMVDGKIYVIAGFNNSNTGDISNLNEVYDPKTDTWTTKATIPYGVYSHCSVVVDNSIYVFSAQSASPGSKRPDNGPANQIYDTKTDTWTFGKTPPKRAHRSGAVVTSGRFAPKRIYVIGGEVGYMEATNTNQVYDPQTDTWSTGAPMPTARQGVGLAVVDDLIYAIGGIYPEYYTPTSDSITSDVQYSLLTNTKNNPVNFVPQENCALNEQYTPIGYERSDTTEKPPASTIEPNATPTPTSKLEQTLQFPSTTEALIIIGVVVLIFGLVVNFTKKEKNLQ